jgi:hypothetical protein
MQRLWLVVALLGVAWLLGCTSIPPEDVTGIPPEGGTPELQRLQSALVICHRANGAAVTIAPSTAAYREALHRANQILEGSVFVEPSKAARVKLMVDPQTFPDKLQGMDYVEVQPKQLLSVPGQEVQYDRVVFVLSGEDNGLIFLHSTRERWGVWQALDQAAQASLSEFVPSD